MSPSSESLYQAWRVIEPILSIQNEADYWRGVEQLNFLLEAIGDEIDHPLSSLVKTLGILLDAYENQVVQIADHIRGVEALRHLMEEFDLTASDLPEVGDESNLEEILNGHRSLTLQQTQMLGTRFNVSPKIFR